MYQKGRDTPLFLYQKGRDTHSNILLSLDIFTLKKEEKYIEKKLFVYFPLFFRHHQMVFLGCFVKLNTSIWVMNRNVDTREMVGLE